MTDKVQSVCPEVHNLPEKARKCQKDSNIYLTFQEVIRS